MSTNGNSIEKFRTAFESKFVHFGDVLDVLITGYQERHVGGNDGTNVILYGPGGYGKSQMSLEFARNALQGSSGKGVFIQSVGASTREDEIWGGLDLVSLRDGDSIKYRLENSFLNYDIVIFEEFFDLPTRILLDFKDTFSAREYRKGELTFKSKTRFIIACTNTPPSDIAKRSAALEALIQRFPLRLEVRWPTYQLNDYIKMYHRQVPEHKALAPLLAYICCGIASKGIQQIPPRLAIDAMHSVSAHAFSHGRNVVVPSDLNVLRYVYPFTEAVKETAALIKEGIARYGGALELNRISVESDRLIAQLESVGLRDVDTYAAIDSKLSELQQNLSDVRIPDEKGESFELKASIARKISNALRQQKQISQKKGS